MPRQLTISIDGPAGSGKSSVARRIAALLGYSYLDSGAMYRALALKALERKVALSDEARLEALAKETHIELKEHQEKGEKFTLAEVLDEVRERDRRDRERKVSPLVRAADAVLVDNTAMGIEETARLIVMLARERQDELAGTAAGRHRAS